MLATMPFSCVHYLHSFFGGMRLFMKTTRFSILYMVIIVVMCILVLPATGHDFLRGNDKGISDFTIPEVDSFTTSGGIKVFYLKDNMPHFSVTISLGYGKIYEKSENAGISEMLANTLNMGGSKKYPGEKLHRAIESLGGQYNVNASWEDITISFRFLERHALDASSIMKSIMTDPDMTDVYVNNARSVLLEAVRRRKDSPEQLAFEKLRQILFDGDGYGAVMNEKTLKSIDAKALSSLWKNHVVSGNIRVGVVTSLPMEKVKNIMNNVFSDIPEGKPVYYTVDMEKLRHDMRKKAGTIYLIKKDIPQATIVYGTLAPETGTSAVYPLTVGNYILGGGSFSSRLMREVRVKRGLSYAVSSLTRFRKNTGIFLAYAQTRTGSAPKTAGLMESIMKKFASKGAVNDEMNWARESVVNSYIFEFDSPYAIISKYIWMDYNQLDVDYFDMYPEKIRQVSQDEVRSSFDTLFKDGFIRVVVGNESLKGSLASLGTVEVVELE